MACFKVCEGVEISAEDEREYRVVNLPNALQVLLIHDATTDKAAAAMDVGIGHFSDPDEIPGLAHFLEHMLFLGTEKYPDENSYSSYLSEHGGMSNAYTSTENTNYYFDVSHPYLEDALDRFAQFFIAPLFTEAATDREMKAVDSENAKNLQNDGWRSHQLFRSLSRKEHPHSKFGTGNLVTLEEEPRKAGISVRDKLLKFHKELYSSNISKLVVLGRQSLDELEKLVTEKFHAVLNYDRSRPVWTSFGDAFGPEEMQRLVTVVPVKELREISITWPVGPTKEHYNEKPCRYLSHLVGHEGTGSLLSYLKAKGWANELSAGTMTSQSDFSAFGVSVDATDLGIEHWQDVVQATFGYVRMLQGHGPQQWIFDECQAVNAMNFRFKSKEQPSSYCSNLAGNMHDYAPKDIISGAHLSRSYDPALIKRFLDDMTVERVQVAVVAKCMEGKTDTEEKWYRTPYKSEKLDADLLQKWRSEPIDAELHLPERNDLIATDFSLVGDTDFAWSANRDGAGDPAAAPVLLLHTPKVRAFYKVDKVFSKPKLSMLLAVNTPVAYDSAESSVLCDLYTRLVREELNEYSYMASMAGMHYVLQQTIQGLEVIVSGYNEKLVLLLEKVLEKMKTFAVTEELYTRLLDKCKRKYQNFFLEQPYQHALYNTNMATEATRWHHMQKLAVIDSLTLDDLLSFKRRLLSSVHIEALVHGNVGVAGAKALVAKAEEILVLRPLACPSVRDLRVVQMPTPSDFIYREHERNEADPNSAIQVYFQIGEDDLKLRMLIHLFASIAREPIFNQLRTNEQLGYMVFSGSINTYSILGFRIIVQSDKKGADYLDERIELLLSDGEGNLREKLVTQTPEQFQDNVDAAVAKKLEADKTPWEESQRHWSELSNQTYLFGRKDVEAEQLKQLSKDDVIEFFDTYLAVGAPQRRKLSSQIFGNAHPMPGEEGGAEEKAGTTVISDFDDFKRSLPMCPGRVGFQGAASVRSW